MGVQRGQNLSVIGNNPPTADRISWDLAVAQGISFLGRGTEGGVVDLSVGDRFTLSAIFEIRQRFWSLPLRSVCGPRIFALGLDKRPKTNQ